MRPALLGAGPFLPSPLWIRLSNYMECVVVHMIESSRMNLFGLRKAMPGHFCLRSQEIEVTESLSEKV
jgi:hypothetical protein